MSTQADKDKEIDVTAILVAIWYRRRRIFVTICATLALAVIYLHFATNYYTASMIILPAQNLSGADRLNSSLGGLASLAGVRLSPNNATAPFESYLMRINTHETAEAMMRRADIASVVFPNGWDEKKRTWLEKRSVVGDFVAQLRWFVVGRQTLWSPPDAVAMEEFIKQRVGVNRDKDTGSVTLSFDNKDRNFAIHFLTILNQTIDGSVRAAALRDSEAYIDYISRKLKSVTVTEQRQSLTALLSDEEKKAVLAGSGLPYAAEVFSAPFAPLTPNKPQALLTLVIAIAIGIALGVTQVFMFPTKGGDDDHIQAESRWAALRLRLSKLTRILLASMRHVDES